MEAFEITNLEKSFNHIISSYICFIKFMEPQLSLL